MAPAGSLEEKTDFLDPFRFSDDVDDDDEEYEIEEAPILNVNLAGSAPVGQAPGTSGAASPLGGSGPLTAATGPLSGPGPLGPVSAAGAPLTGGDNLSMGHGMFAPFALAQSFKNVQFTLDYAPGMSPLVSAGQLDASGAPLQGLDPLQPVSTNLNASPAVSGATSLTGPNPLAPVANNLEAGSLLGSGGNPAYTLNLAGLDGGNVPVSLVQNFTEIHLTLQYDKDKVDEARANGSHAMQMIEIRGLDAQHQPFSLMQTFKDVDLSIDPMAPMATMPNAMDASNVTPLVGVDPLRPVSSGNATGAGDLQGASLDSGVPLLNLSIAGRDAATDAPVTMVQRFRTIHLNLSMGSDENEMDEESLAKRRHAAEMQASNLKKFERKKFATFKNLCKAQGRNPEDIARCTTLAQLKHLAKTGEAPVSMSFAGNSAMAWTTVQQGGTSV